MITKFDKYIDVKKNINNINKIKKFIHSNYTKIRNVKTIDITNNITNIVIHTNIYNIDESLYTIRYDNNTYYLSEHNRQVIMITDDYKNIIEYLREYIDNVYDNFDFNPKNSQVVNRIMVDALPIFNSDKFNEFIIDKLYRMPEYIKYFYKYLNYDNKNKLKHYFDASKFDLL
jgi:hypothetical protein